MLKLCSVSTSNEELRTLIEILLFLAFILHYADALLLGEKLLFSTVDMGNDSN